MIAEIAFPIKLRKNFHYRVPENLRKAAVPGVRVKAPFGFRKAAGFIVNILENSGDIPPGRLKEIESIIDPYPLYGRELEGLADFISSTWGSSTGEVLDMLVPSIARADGENSASCEPVISRKPGNTVELTPDQSAVIDEVNSCLREKKPAAFLLYGEAMTGKTEIYLRLIEEAVLNGGQALFLIPDIALVNQYLKEVRARFGAELVSAWHSRLTPKTRREAWSSIASGKIKITVGTRSACMLPFRNLALSVIDEEQDESYKQEEIPPYYHAREVLLFRAGVAGAVMVAGSATPSLESYHAVESGRMRILRVSQRVKEGGKRPEIRIVDRKKEKRAVLTAELERSIKDSLDKKEQVILLLNRRGFFASVFCLNCGRSWKCGKCGINMGIRRNPVSGLDSLVCRRCGGKSEMPEKCPACSNRIFRKKGTGTQQLEEEIHSLFPAARVLRLDSDSFSKTTGQGRAAYEIFSTDRAEILIGTRLISRGWHFTGVTLFGIVDADTELHSGDFRGSEKTAQMLFQAAGRAEGSGGRGKVVIQTYETDNSAILSVVSGTYEDFIRQELTSRSQLGYPPFRRLVRAIFSSGDGKKAEDAAEAFIEFMDKSFQPEFTRAESLEILGPAPCSGKGEKQERHHLLIKIASDSGLRTFVGAACGFKAAGGVRVKIVPDPYDFR